MDKIAKFLLKLTKQERISLERILNQLFSGNKKGLNIKKLKGHSSIFRVRYGRFRIIYEHQKEKITLLELGRRKEDTYKDF